MRAISHVLNQLVSIFNASFNDSFMPYYGRTPINDASYKDHLEVVKYLYETCHTKITNETSGQQERKILCFPHKSRRYRRARYYSFPFWLFLKPFAYS